MGKIELILMPRQLQIVLLKPDMIHTGFDNQQRTRELQQ